MEENKSLTVKDDGVNLPVYHVVQGETDDFRSLVTEAFPPAVSAEVCEIRMGSEEGHSRLGIMLTTLFCLTVLGLSYWLWPRPEKPVKTVSMNIKDDHWQVSKEYMPTAKKAQLLLEAKNYNECASILLRPIAEIMDGIDNEELLRGNRTLFVLYCTTVIDGRLHDGHPRRCLELLSTLQKLEPDDFKWHSFWLIIESERLLRNFERISRGDVMRLNRIEQCLAKAEYVLRRDEELNKGENAEAIRLITARLLTSAWLLKGADGGFPDDYGAPGVEERERAYGIATKYANSIDFILLRIFILDKMISHSGIFNRYYFMGAVYYRNNRLEEERTALKNRMEEFK